jgi:cell division transport system permease protein
MARHGEKYYKRRIKTSHFTTVISIMLVLFMLGMLGVMILNAKRLSDYVKENIGFSIMIREGVREAGILELQKRLDRESYVKSTEYITKEKAALILKRELGEDFIGFLGYNPLLPSIDLRLRAGYANPDSLRKIEKQLLLNEEIKEVTYQKSLVDMVNQNLQRIGLVILGFSAILLLIAIGLINNTIRLSVYSRRFIIRSMQLVGATQGFIRRPFLVKGIFDGLISGILANFLLVGVMYLAIQQMPELMEIQEPEMFIFLAAAVILLGIFLSWISTYFAVRKYLRMKTDDLYHA